MAITILTGCFLEEAEQEASGSRLCPSRCLRLVLWCLITQGTSAPLPPLGIHQCGWNHWLNLGVGSPQAPALGMSYELALSPFLPSWEPRGSAVATMGPRGQHRCVLGRRLPGTQSLWPTCPTGPQSCPPLVAPPPKIQGETKWGLSLPLPWERCLRHKVDAHLLGILILHLLRTCRARV